MEVENEIKRKTTERRKESLKNKKQKPKIKSSKTADLKKKKFFSPYRSPSKKVKKEEEEPID